MFPLSKELARKSSAIISSEPKEALERILTSLEEHFVKQINAELSSDALKILAAKIDLLRNLKNFERVIRQNAN
jgi:hypothetical protein